MNIDNSINDNVLISLSLNGDESAFKSLIKENINKSKSLIRKNYNISYHDFEDISQNTTIKVWNSLSFFNTKKKFFSWFFSIFRNETLDFLRHKLIMDKQVLNEKEIVSEEERIAKLEKILEEYSLAFFEKEKDIENYQELINIIFNNLSKSHKEILEMIYLDGVSYKEASNRLNIPVGSIMSRVFYAKKESKKILEEMELA